MEGLKELHNNIMFYLVILTVILGIYPSIILDSLNYNVSSLLYNFSFEV